MTSGFSNDFALLEAEVAQKFPQQIDGFRALAQEVRELDAFNLGALASSAREAVQRHISDPLLEDMLFCPVHVLRQALRSMTWTTDSLPSCFVHSFSKALHVARWRTSRDQTTAR